MCAYVWVWAKPLWPRIRGGKRCHGPRDWSLLRDPINKEKISLRKGNTAVSKEELNLLVALHSTATRQKVISLCDAVRKVHSLSFSLRIQHCLFHFSHIYLRLDVCHSFPSAPLPLSWRQSSPGAISFAKSMVTTMLFTSLEAEHLSHW